MEKQLPKPLHDFKVFEINKKTLSKLKGGDGDSEGEGIITEEDIIV